MTIAFVEIKEAARKLLAENIKLKKNEKVVLVTDKKKCQIFDALKRVLKEDKIKFEILKLSPQREHSSPIPSAAKVFENADVIVAPTLKSISHSPETYAARKKGARVASMPGITSELFVEAMKADSEKIKRINRKLAKKLKNAKVANVITPSGTNLKMSLKDAIVYSHDDGDISRKGILNNVPFGEVETYGGMGSGKLVIDSWGEKIKPGDGAWIYIKRGKIVEWNKKGKLLVDQLRRVGECGLRIIEFSIGTNKIFKEPRGNVLCDEKIYGSVHVAFGGGPTRECPIHIDVILLKPTVWVSGRKVVDRGRIN